ncbi:MAG: PAS domain S-box protein [Desulfomonilaceae bacterium]|nr:PAS domain S-box protein [Desulfomonilaceae bacterium]
MKEDRFHELVSDLTVAIRAKEKGRRKVVRRWSQTQESSESHHPFGSQVIIYTRESHGGFQPTFVSDNVSSQLGYAPDELTREMFFWEDRIHPEDAGRVLKELPRVLKTGHEVLKYRFRHKNGTYVLIRDELNLVRHNGDSSGEILGSWIDITESEETEEELRRTLARCRSLIRSSPLGMVSFDGSAEITESNPAAADILGFPFHGKMDLPDLFSLLPVFECGISEAIFRCLETGEGGVGHLQYRSKTDRDVHVKMRVMPVRDGTGTITGAHAFVEDVSDQRRAEDLIVRSERLKVLGQIAGGIGHNFSNLLQILSGNANMALTSLHLKDYHGLENNLKQINESTRSATEVVRWIQQLGRHSSSTHTIQKEVFDLSDVVGEAIEMCKLWSKTELERNNIHISYELDLHPGCHVSGVSDQLSWVVLNFLKNSVEALPAGGTIKVKTRIQEDQVILSVTDNGVGIPPEDIKKLAQPFWSSKVGHAGMGLAFNGEIMRRHAGSMGVRRGKPHGAAFKVRLPFILDPSEERRAIAELSLEKGFRILLIDDEVPVVRMFEKGLTLLGHTVFPTFSGRKGLKLFKETPVDAVVCGLAMPEMNGWEVASAIHALCAKRDTTKPPVIILTGCDTQPDEKERAGHVGVDRCLNKPIAVPKLHDIITEEIGRASDDSAFSGRIEGVDLLEYMQLLLFNSRKVVLEIVSRSGTTGRVYVDKGEIGHAECDDLEGEQALFKCLAFKGGSFSTHPWRRPTRYSIKKSGQALLIEAARRRDEMRNGTHSS